MANHTGTVRARDATISTKSRILEAAEAIFAARGFDGASTREIAAAAGANISSLHYHWDTKEKLYFGVIENIYGQILELVAAAMPTGEGAADSSVLDTAVGRLFDFFADHPNAAKLLIRRSLEEGVEGTEVEKTILLPSWRRFAEWTHTHSGSTASREDVAFFMLTLNAALLFLASDSSQGRALLGGSVRKEPLRGWMRQRFTDMVRTLLREESSGRKQ